MSRCGSFLKIIGVSLYFAHFLCSSTIRCLPGSSLPSIIFTIRIFKMIIVIAIVIIHDFIEVCHDTFRRSRALTILALFKRKFSKHLEIWKPTTWFDIFSDFISGVASPDMWIIRVGFFLNVCNIMRVFVFRWIILIFSMFCYLFLSDNHFFHWFFDFFERLLANIFCSIVHWSGYFFDRLSGLCFDRLSGLCFFSISGLFFGYGLFCLQRLDTDSVCIESQTNHC